MAIADAPPVLHALRRLAIAGGGTAGHVYPAIALAEACRLCTPPVDVLFVGTASGHEPARAHGLRQATVSAAPYYGVGPVARLRAVTELVAGTRAARRILRADGAQLVLGLGNFASAGTVLAARSLGVPVVLHEANARGGLANEWLARTADRILLGFEAARADFRRTEVVVTGTPIRPAIAALGASRRAPWAGSADRPFHVLVTGGSQGAAFLNAHVPPLLDAVARHGVTLAVRHQTGATDVERVRAAYAGAGLAADVSAYRDDLAADYAWADLAVTCAGAGTLAELAAVGLPALVVPLATAARDHQTANARAFAAATGTWWTPEDAWDVPALTTRLLAFVRDAAALAAAAERVRRAATPAAAVAILQACDAVLCARAGVTAAPASGSARR